MAIIDCAECGNEVSDKAKTCPHCGAKVKKPMRPIEKVLAGVLIVLFIMALASGGDEEARVQVSEQAPETPSEAECTTEDCIANKYIGDAIGPCKRAVERYAKHQAEWDDGFMLATFSRFSFDESGSVVSYFGDKVKFQNGFGAWTNMVYKCDYNIETKSLVAADVTEGRL